MLLLGLLIVAAAVAFGIVVIADNLGGGPHYSVGLFDHHLATVNTQGAFLAGIALTLLFCLGLLMLTAGARRERRRSSELRAARRERRAAAKADRRAATDNGPATVVGTSEPAAEDDTVVGPVLTKQRRGPNLFSSH
ncbi:hypothetical protein ACEZDB_08255 [Streptacidiphilus sp. N1-3]|uniref:Integral membrane protein n=1 Tax=Streptacidiphilus alkalitolerans TaxID=3342712 RepID=A0ABV6WX76_9ACTN